MDKPDRRPLASRNAAWAQALTRWLASTSVNPNQISIASMAAAAAAGAALWASGSLDGTSRAALLLVAAAGCQLRLICNLMDGLLAVEAGRQEKDGAFWNEFPDRVSDIMIIVGMGLGLGQPALGWAAACLAVLTAYTRELGNALGLGADYRGPMAKPQRMAVVTVASLAGILEPLWSGDGGTLYIALWLITLGSGLTATRRAAGVVGEMRRR